MHSNRSSSLAFEVEKLHVVQEDDRMIQGLAFLGQLAYIPHLDVVLEVTSSLLMSSQGMLPVSSLVQTMCSEDTGS